MQQHRHLTVSVAAVILVMGILLIGGIILAGGNGGENGGGPGAVGSQNTPVASSFAPDFATSFTAFDDQLARLKSLNGRIAPEDIEALKRATARLADSGQPPNDARQVVERALHDVYALSLELSQNADLPETQDAFQELASVTESAANDLGFLIATPTLAPTDVATPAPTEVATPTPTFWPPPERTVVNQFAYYDWISDCMAQNGSQSLCQCVYAGLAKLSLLDAASRSDTSTLGSAERTAIGQVTKDCKATEGLPLQK